MPKVSVIVPNYNHARYLGQRLKSILDQTFEDFDLTYLDDASSDDSNVVFAEFASEARIKAIYNESNSGSPFKQWNKGVRSTTGEYIWIAESDDVAAPNFLATLVPILDKNPDVGLAYCQSCQIDTNNVVINQSMDLWLKDLSPDRWTRDFVNNGKVECQEYLISKNTIPNASAVLIRRSVYEAIGGAEEKLSLAGDWMTWIRILLKSDIAFCAQMLNSFRTHKSSVRSNSVLNGTEIYECLVIRQDLIENVSILPETLAKLQEELIVSWVNLLLDPESIVDSKAIIKFYKLAKINTPSLENIICKQVSLHAIKWLFVKIKPLLPASVVRMLKNKTVSI